MFPAGIPEPHLHRPARLLEPQQEERLPRNDGHAQGQQGGQVRGIRQWLDGDEHAWGRPVDLLVMPDGALLISDDIAGVVYRVTYR